MGNITAKMSNALNFIKGFDAGYTSRVDDKLIIKHENKIYRLTLEEVEDNAKELSFGHIEKYL